MKLMAKIIFVSKKKFEELKNKNYFIETAKNFNNLYGSPFTSIHKSNKKQHLLFDIDWKGARKIRNHYNKKNIIDFSFYHLLSQSLEED